MPKHETNSSKRQNIYLIILVVSIFNLLFSGCDSTPASEFAYLPPKNIDDGLNVGTFEEVSIAPGPIGEVVNQILDGQYPEMHSLLIVRDDKLVFEKYFIGHEYQWDAPYYHGELLDHNKYTPHTVMSVGKSFTSACIGIAIDNGFIESVNQSIFDYLPEYQHLNTGGKDKISIEHLLTMTSGLKWQEWGASNTSPDSDLFKLWIDCEDQITCTLEKPLASDPGTDFTYNGGGMVVLGEIIKNATGMDIEAFSAQYLFEPLGIDPPEWERFESGIIAQAYGGFYITPRDMAKFGLLYLNNGVWDGEQIISAQWVEKSEMTYPGNDRIRVPLEDVGLAGYSYTWWTKQFSVSGKTIDIFYAEGWGGQKIYVIPELDTVVVITGGNYTSKNHNFKILKKYIIPAVD